MSHHDFERRQRDREERQREQAERQRERARRRAERERHRERHHGERKEKVLHTRISEQLSDDIRRMAEELRVPVSNLVRNVLEETFSVVETVSENVGELLEEVLDETEVARSRYRGRRHRRHWRHEDAGDVEDAEEASAEAETADEPDAEPRPEFPEVLGWQPLLLNQDADCADCGRGVPRGERAFVGVGAQGLSSTVLCRECTEARG